LYKQKAVRAANPEYLLVLQRIFRPGYGLKKVGPANSPVDVVKRCSKTGAICQSELGRRKNLSFTLRIAPQNFWRFYLARTTEEGGSGKNAKYVGALAVTA